MQMQHHETKHCKQQKLGERKVLRALWIFGKMQKFSNESFEQLLSSALLIQIKHYLQKLSQHLNEIQRAAKLFSHLPFVGYGIQYKLHAGIASCCLHISNTKTYNW